MKIQLPDAVRYIPPGPLDAQLKKLGKYVAISKGKFLFPAHCEVRDLDWNHMDQQHRPCIHNAFQGAIRLATGPDFALSLTKLKVLGFGWSFLLADIRLGPGLFCQSFTLFNLFYVHQVQRFTSGGMEMEWKIVSHPLLKFLHGFISRYYLRVNKVQNNQDVPIRIRRAELRKKGYRFETDEPNFLNSNSATNNVIFPKLQQSYHFSIMQLPLEGFQKVEVGPISLLISRKGDQEISVWTEICPHEGGPLEGAKLCGNKLQCPWHEYQFPGAHLTAERSEANLGHLRLTLNGNELIVSDERSRQSLGPLVASQQKACA